MNNNMSKTEIVYFALNIILLILGVIFKGQVFSPVFFTFMWILLVIWGLKKCQKTDSALTISNSSALRGISAVEIMLGHIGLASGNIFQFPNRKAGILFVGIFFMLSGFGLAYGFDNKKDYIKHFFRNRMVAILIPALFVILIEIIYYQTISFQMLSGSGRWYIIELLGFYTIFFVSYKLLGNKGWIAISIFSGIFIVVAFLCGLTNPWYGSTLCFPLGMAYYKFQKNTKTLSLGKRLFFIVLSGIILIISIAGFFLKDGTFFGNVICRSLASVSFCVALLLILEKISIENQYSKWLSNISYEIFLIHPIVIVIVNDHIHIIKEYTFLVTVCVTLITIIVACFLKILSKGIITVINKNPTKE